jgi:hypothetical protein
VYEQKNIKKLYSLEYLYKREVFPTELTSDEELERGPGEWRRINVVYEWD